MSKVQHAKIKKNLGLSCVIASFFFLFNPDIGIVDILPDLFGYILMCSGLSMLSMLNDDIYEAHQKFKKMIIVSALKLVAVYILYGVFAADQQPSGSLLFAFCFGVVELMLLVPAFKKLYDGLSYLANRKGGQGILLNKKGKFAGDVMRSASIIFVIAKLACAILPETLSLTITDYVDDGPTMYLYEFIAEFRIIGFTVGLVFGIAFLVRSVKFFKRFIRETELVATLSQGFSTELDEREGVFIKKNLSAGLFVLVAAAVLCLDLHVPDYNFIPDIAAAALFFVGAWLLKKYTSKYKLLAASSVGYFVVSLVASIVRISFLNEYGFFSAANYKEEAYDQFVLMVGTTVVENIVFLAVVWCAVMVLRQIVDVHTGAEITSEYNRERQRITSAQNEHYKKLWTVLGLAVVSAVCSVLYDVMLIERGYLADTMWVIDFTVTGFFAGLFVLRVLAILDDIKIRYMYS